MFDRAGSSHRPVRQHEAGDSRKVAAIPRDQDQLVRQGERGDFPILRANADGAKLLKPTFGRLVIGEDREAGKIKECLHQQSISVNAGRTIAGPSELGDGNRAAASIDGGHR